MNVTILTGNLGHDIELKTSKGTTYTSFSICDNYRSNGETKSNWTRVAAFNGLAKSLAILGTGSTIEVRAHLEQTTFERDGVSFTSPQVIADDVLFRNVKPRADAAGDNEAEAES